MGLVDYSGSESSDEEQQPREKQTAKAKTTSNKPTFQKVVDSSEPHKIRVNLPEPSKSTPDDDGAERPSKRAKIGTGGLSGFNALLPAPKRVAVANTGAAANGFRKGGLGSGVSLRTGAAPGFSREPEPSEDPVEGEGMPGRELETDDPVQSQNDGRISLEEDRTLPKPVTMEETKPIKRTAMFKPLSVARKPQKKKTSPSDDSGTKKTKEVGSLEQFQPAPKVSLFSTGNIDRTRDNVSTPQGAYVPMVYQSDAPSGIPANVEETEEINSNDPNLSTFSAYPTPPPPDSLDTIASDLNLSKSAKRQLLGRQKNNSSAINVVNFNTDKEYEANEVARKSGEQVQHNPVRAIAPGRHSLKQLVNMGTMQADALEESFASGRRNRSEAGSKYGW